MPSKVQCQRHRMLAKAVMRSTRVLLTAGVLGVTTIGLFALQVGAETPQQRCERETNAYNQAQQAAWQATHPGQTVPDPAPWPAYQCLGGNSGNNSNNGAGVGGTGTGSTGAGSTGGGLTPRESRSSAMVDEANQRNAGVSGFSQNGQDVGDPRRGISTQNNSATNNGGGTGTGGSALDSARSNVRMPNVTRNTTGGTTGEGAGGAGDATSGGAVSGGQGAGAGAASGISGVVGQDLTDADGTIYEGNPDIGERSVDAGMDSGVVGADATGDGNTSGQVTSVDEVGVGSSSENNGEETTEKSAGDDYPITRGLAFSSGGVAAFVGGGIGALGYPRLRRRRGQSVKTVGTGTTGVAELSMPGVGNPMQDLLAAVREAFESGHLRIGINQLDGDRQVFVLLLGEDSPRVHRFAVSVPEGGSMRVRDNGGVDVLDADGTVVDSYNRPWAYDASGREVETWYEVDEGSGEIVQYVNPGDDARYPIIADPEQNTPKTTDTSKAGMQYSDTKAEVDGVDGEVPPAALMGAAAGPVVSAGVSQMQQEELQRQAQAEQLERDVAGLERFDDVGDVAVDGSYTSQWVEEQGSQAVADRQAFLEANDPDSHATRYHEHEYQPTPPGFNDGLDADGNPVAMVCTPYEIDPSSNDPLRRMGQVSAQESFEDAYKPERAPDFEGEVSDEDLAGQERNRMRVELEAAQQVVDARESGEDVADEVVDQLVAGDRELTPAERELMLGDQDQDIELPQGDGRSDVIRTDGSAIQVDTDDGRRVTAMGTQANPIQGPIPLEYHDPSTAELVDTPVEGADAYVPEPAPDISDEQAVLEYLQRIDPSEWEYTAEDFGLDSVGGTMDATADAIDWSAKQDTDRVAKNIGRGFAPLGAALTTGVSIQQDIKDGVDPTVAIASNGAGAAAGTLASFGTTAILTSAGIAASPVLVTGAAIAASGVAAWAVTNVVRDLFD